MNRLILPHSNDQVQGGFNPSNIRLMLTIDFALNTNFMLGARVGYVLGTYDGSAAKNDGKTFAPVHLEARATYVIGKDALAKPGFAPMVFLGAGASEFDSKVDVTVKPSGSSFYTSGSPAGPVAVSAWAIGGPMFFDVGVGGRYAMSARAAIYGSAKFTGVLGGTAGFLPAVGPEVGGQIGF
jgi:hypothetical protein